MNIYNVIINIKRFYFLIIYFSLEDFIYLFENGICVLDCEEKRLFYL